MSTTMPPPDERFFGPRTTVAPIAAGAIPGTGHAGGARDGLVDDDARRREQHRGGGLVERRLLTQGALRAP